MKINFFLNSLSIHQAPMIKILSSQFFVRVYYDTAMSDSRKKLGWNLPDFGQAELIPLSDFGNKYLEETGVETVNIFSGLNAYRNIHFIFLKTIKDTPAKTIVQMEKIDFFGFKGIFRKLKYAALAKRYNRKIDRILCQGGRQQLIDVGFVFEPRKSKRNLLRACFAL